MRISSGAAVAEQKAVRRLRASATVSRRWLNGVNRSNTRNSWTKHAPPTHSNESTNAANELDNAAMASKSVVAIWSTVVVSYNMVGTRLWAIRDLTTQSAASYNGTIPRTATSSQLSGVST